MAKYEQIMESSWVNATLFPESIPHLFHYDLAYLWVLEKQRDLRPTTWRERVEAWRCLIHLFFIGELDMTDEIIGDPLAKYTSSFGVTKVSWLSVKGSGERIGVLSPAVLVRPLPDFDSDDLNQLKQALAQKQRPDELSFFIRLAIAELKKGQPEGSFRHKIALILNKEFNPGQSGNLAGAPGFHRSVPMLSQLRWTQQPGQPPCVDDVDILVRGDGAGNVFVPLCECGHPLTQPKNASPFDVVGDRFEVVCKNQNYAHQSPVQEVMLSRFLIWVRNNEEVVVWKRQGVYDKPSSGLPPDPKLSGTVVEFEWTPAHVGGDRDNRFLKLRFQNKTIVEKRIDEILFEKLLVPGKFAEFSGLPIRSEWIDALSNSDRIKPEVNPGQTKVTYKNLELKGWPVPISRTFSGDFAVHNERDLAVGIYPDPRLVPEKWKWYRFFVHGLEHRSYAITQRQPTTARAILPWLSETTEGFQEWLSLTSSSDANEGVTYWTRAEHKVLQSKETSRIFLGIDFGTTNTIVYFLPPNKDSDDVLADPEHFCLKPSESAGLVKWLAESDAARASPTIGDFLPGPSYLPDRLDRSIIPSDLWCFGDEFLIRWDAEEPRSGSKIESGFKWDIAYEDKSAERNAFLREVSFLALPFILKSAIESRSIATWDLDVNLGFTYPLSFSGQARARLSNAHNQLRTDLRRLTGMSFTLHSIDESSACMNILGSFNRSDTLLVADMGGGSLDLALFTGLSDGPHQIGSVRFAGEACLKVLSEKRGFDLQELRDRIAEGRCHNKYGGDAVAIATLQQFTGMALEFLRTMIEAFERERPNQQIHLVLAGNGWHLVEAFSAQTRNTNPQQVFRKHYEDLIELLGNARIVVQNPLPTLRSNKHLVAIGALKQAQAGGYQLDANQFAQSRLPAGRGLKFGNEANPLLQLQWSDLVGGVDLSKAAIGEDLKQQDLHVDLENMPPLQDPWRSYFLRLFKVTSVEQIPKPPINILLGKLREAIVPGVSQQLAKGPLQIILEYHWLDEMKRIK